MTKVVQLHPDAIAEAKAAREWYMERSPSAADAFTKELDNAILQVSNFPQQGLSFIRETRRFLLRRFPFSVVYRESEEHIEVIAVAHARRKPGYWKKRS